MSSCIKSISMASRGSQHVHQHDHDKWGWVMVAVVFLSMVVIMGNLSALGVLLMPMTSDLDSELWLIGWIAVWSNVMKNCTGPVVGALSRLFGSRPVMIFGGILLGLGFILTSISHNIFATTFFIVGLTGLGSAFLFINSFVVLAPYFKERYPLAIGLSMMGTPIGVIVYAPVTQILLDTYGWRGTMLLLGGISFHLVAFGMLVRRDPSSSPSDTEQYQKVANSDREGESSQEEGSYPAGDETSTSEKRHHPSPDLHKSSARKYFRHFIRTIDFRVLADVRFILLAFGRFAVTFVYNAFVMYMVSHGQLSGLNHTQASFLPTAFGVGNVIGRLVAPFLQQVGAKLSVTFWACLGAALMSVSFLADALTGAFLWQLAVSGLIGVGYGTVVQAVDVMMRFLATDDRLVSVLGWLGLFKGVAGMLGALIAGLIFKWTGSFTITFYMYSGMMLLSIPLFIIEAVYGKSLVQ
ncbi:monocarboxylate transporter 3-like [Patiria miniata]|uniref:Major facilitator superfamily (MFS) profile domain-containing protein n=1 Tax=Patiria miniata TaxID=46514 RepID=A0A914AYE8_PATMI|nr:monocarboxylate transporter 3-like [Patiria miniata]